ncbi:hypothetical protein D1007_59737 [Hordeum vulgare]|nr:hypothetical protein D1007_59737 [Hordeum vulgare]
MDSHADIPLTPSYARDPTTVVVVAASTGANPSPASFGLVSAGAPPSTSVARSLFMARRTTSVGGGATAPDVTRAPPLKASKCASSEEDRQEGVPKEEQGGGWLD